VPPVAPPVAPVAAEEVAAGALVLLAAALVGPVLLTAVDFDELHELSSSAHAAEAATTALVLPNRLGRSWRKTVVSRDSFMWSPFHIR
jgi:hypothetical protein